MFDLKRGVRGECPTGTADWVSFPPIPSHQVGDAKLSWWDLQQSLVLSRAQNAVINISSPHSDPKRKSPNLNIAYKIWNYMLFFQWSDFAGYWLVHLFGFWRPFLMNIGCWNNFILSTDAVMLLIQLRSGCQWRLIASGWSKLIPAEMSFICFSNSGKKYWWQHSELY